MPESVLALHVDGVGSSPSRTHVRVDLALAWRTDDRSPALATLLRALEANGFVALPAPEASPDARHVEELPMKIAEIEAIPFAIPYRKPLRFASGEVHVADHVLVRVAHRRRRRRRRRGTAAAVHVRRDPAVASSP